jgi:TolB-like protein
MRYILTIILLFTTDFCMSEREKQLAIIESYSKPPFERLAETLSKNVSSNNKRTIVLSFITSEGKEHKYGIVFAEKLTTELVKQKEIIVLDRLMFGKKLKDNSLDLAVGADLASVRKIGEILNIDSVVVGIATPFANGYDLNVRMIDAKTGLILSAEEAYYTDKIE